MDLPPRYAQAPPSKRGADDLEGHDDRAQDRAGKKLGSSHSGRGSLAAKVIAATGDVETVQTILGHSCLDHSKLYLTVDQLTIRHAFAVALA
ncbi:hypothetical protein ALP03_200300 [Pseudomonas amygdali pv. tabaci]|uniref:Uncharacterized protein n=1 Tax=Pseudomonas amygdali pv. tabaci TaxID=322 RepID=A0A3M6HS61_PSEAJ|nr:hypothetical protein ALP03_200300 [Pseudomonas amygdali pv. tabaci]